LLALELAQGSQLTAGNGMDSRRTILGSIDVQSTVTEIDRIPTQGHKLAYPQAMPIGDQDHGGVTVAMAVAVGGDNQAVDLGVGQIFAGANLGIGPTRRGFVAYCPIIGAWRYQREV